MQMVLDRLHSAVARVFDKLYEAVQEKQLDPGCAAQVQQLLLDPGNQQMLLQLLAANVHVLHQRHEAQRAAAAAAASTRQHWNRQPSAACGPTGDPCVHLPSTRACCSCCQAARLMWVQAQQMMLRQFSQETLFNS
jgi:hypothetical protein